MDAQDFENEIAALHEQLRRHERGLRWAILASALSIGVLACTFLLVMVRSAPHEMQVRRLALIDEKGTERLILTTNSHDVRVNGKIFQRRSPASGIILQNAKGDEVGGVAMLDDGTASFTLDGYSGETVNERASLFVLPDGSSGVLVKDTDGHIRARMQIDPENTTQFELAGSTQAPVISAQVSGDGKASWVTPPTEKSEKSSQTNPTSQTGH